MFCCVFESPKELNPDAQVAPRSGESELLRIGGGLVAQSCLTL